MANKKISDLTNLASGSVVDTDLMEVARTSNITNYKFTWANVKAALKTYFDTLYKTIVDFNDHSARHENGGADEISVAGLSGELADDQPLKEHSNTKHSTDLVGETGVITAMTPKTTPADADVTVIEDSAASNVVKSLSWTNIKATLKTYFDTLYDPLGGEVTVLTLLPFPNGYLDTALNVPLTINIQLNSNTKMNLGQIVVPFNITVNKVSVYVSAVGAAGTLKVRVYEEDGSTAVISFTTDSISAAGAVTTTLGSPVSLARGIYYVAIMSIDTADLTVNHWRFNPSPSMHGEIAGEPQIAGYLTVTADTPPATISPTGLTIDTDAKTLYVRLDN